MATQTANIQIRITNVRTSFLNALEPATFQGSEPSYQATFLIPKTDRVQIERVQQAIQKAAVAKWGGKAGAILKQLKSQDRLCLKDGDQKLNGDGDPLEGYAEHFALTSRAKVANPPKVFRGKDLVTLENAAKFRDGVVYSGCYAHALVSIWAQDNDYGKRVNASFDAIIFAKDGPRFGGGGVSEGAARDAFADLIEDEADLMASETEADASGDETLAGLFD